MNLSGNTILITGGGSGIGFALAERFLKRGNKVIVCGRNADKLKSAQVKYPELYTKVCDVSNEAERIELFNWVKKEHPDFNVLVNNAGIQHRTNLLSSNEDWNYAHEEIAINFEAPLHLTMMLLEHLKDKNNAAIINISSGLAFTPMAIAPIYCATKAAIHSFSISLRYQLSNVGIEVIEIAPPAVNTDLGGKNLHTFGTPLNEFADGIFEKLEEGHLEIGYGTSERALRMSRDEVDEAVKRMNNKISL